jgi:HlyD family secretion protein
MKPYAIEQQRSSPRPLRTRTLWARAAVPTCLAAALLAGCSKQEKENEPVVAVQMAPVEKKEIERTVQADAVLFPVAQSAIVPKISAPVKKYFVNRGNRVHQGQLLAVLENRDLQAAKMDNQGAFEQAEAAYQTTTGASLPEEIQKAQLDAEAAKQSAEVEKKVYDNRQKLYAQGALPRKDLEQSLVSYTQAKNQYEMANRHLQALLSIGKAQELKSASGQLASAKGKYMGAEAQLSYSEIRSPIDGVVTDRPLYPGEMAAAGTPLITVMNVSKVIARAHIPQQDAALLKVGDEAAITQPGEEKEIPGKVTIVSPALDPNSTTVEVWVEADNKERRLRPGSSVKLSIVAETVPDATVVPVAALLTGSDGGNTVMVVGDDGKAHQQAVEPGIRTAELVQIEKGVKPGQKVVTAGAFGLPDNTKVTPIAAPQENSKDGGGAADKDKKDQKDEKD